MGVRHSLSLLWTLGRSMGNTPSRSNTGDTLAQAHSAWKKDSNTRTTGLSLSISCPSRDNPNAVVRVSEYSRSSTSRNESLLAISLERQASISSSCSTSGGSGSSCESEGYAACFHEGSEGSDRHAQLTQSRGFADSNLPVTVKEMSDWVPNVEELEVPPLEDPGMVGAGAMETRNDEHVLLEQILEGKGERGVDEVYNMVFRENCETPRPVACEHAALVGNMSACHADGNRDTDEPVALVGNLNACLVDSQAGNRDTDEPVACLVDSQAGNRDTDLDIYCFRFTSYETLDEDNDRSAKESLARERSRSVQEQPSVVSAKESLAGECLHSLEQPSMAYDGKEVNSVAIYNVTFRGIVTLSSCEEPPNALPLVSSAASDS